MIKTLVFLFGFHQISYSQNNRVSYKYSDYTLDSIIKIKLSSLKKKDVSLKDVSDCLEVENDLLQYSIFCKWIVNTLEYDKNFYKNRSINSLLKNKKGNCSVYSMFLDSLCYYNGLESKYISGYVKGDFGTTPQSHAWNSVILNDTMYYTDLTWCDNRNKIFGKSNFSRGFFLVNNPQLFALDHFAYERKERGYKQSFKTFLKSPLFYSVFNNLINDSIDLKPLIKRENKCNLMFHLDRLDTNYTFEDIVLSSTVSVESNEDYIDEKQVPFKIINGNVLLIENFETTKTSVYLFIGVRNKNVKNKIEHYALIAF